MMVCKEMHFTRAAEKLNIAQPTLSQQIKTLEDEVGIPLFDRVGRKIALTEAGKILLQHCRRVFHEMDQAKAAIRDLNGLQIGKLTIGSLTTSMNYLLPSAIVKFKQLYPNIELSVLGLRDGDIKNKILENELDLGITFLPVRGTDMETIPLFTEELTLVVSRNHPLAIQNEMDFQTIGNLPMILLPTNFTLRTLIDQYYAHLGITNKPIMEMSSIDAIVQLVAEDAGATILPKPYFDHLQHDKIASVHLVNPTPQRNIGFIYRKNKFMCTTTRTFIEQVTKTTITI